MLSVLLLMLVMRCIEVSSQPTYDVNCDTSSDKSSSVILSLSRLSRYQTYTARNIDNAAGDLKTVKEDLKQLQDLQILPNSPTDNPCTY